MQGANVCLPPAGSTGRGGEGEGQCRGDAALAPLAAQLAAAVPHV